MNIQTHGFRDRRMDIDPSAQVTCNSNKEANEMASEALPLDE